MLTAEMIRHPLVVDGLDTAFGEALTVAAVTGGVSLGLAIGAAVVVFFFVAALFVLKIGLTALLAVAVVAGALVWGVYPLPQAQWLARAWLSGLVAALAVPVAWACVRQRRCWHATRSSSTGAASSTARSGRARLGRQAVRRGRVLLDRVPRAVLPARHRPHGGAVVRRLPRRRRCGRWRRRGHRRG